MALPRALRLLFISRLLLNSRVNCVKCQTENFPQFHPGRAQPERTRRNENNSCVLSSTQTEQFFSFFPLDFESGVDLINDHYGRLEANQQQLSSQFLVENSLFLLLKLFWSVISISPFSLTQSQFSPIHSSSLAVLDENREISSNQDK